MTTATLVTMAVIALTYRVRAFSIGLLLLRAGMLQPMLTGGPIIAGPCDSSLPSTVALAQGLRRGLIGFHRRGCGTALLPGRHGGS